MSRQLSIRVSASLLAAMTCVATMLIKVPTVGTNGYVNIGDCIVLLSAWLLGNPYGALAAGIGSGLADLLLGYAAYVPGTVVIKFLMAFIGYLVYALIRKTSLPVIASLIISGITAEIIMIVGYFLYEATFLGYGLAAAGSIYSNMIQGVTCLVLGCLLALALSQIPLFKQYFEKR